MKLVAFLLAFIVLFLSVQPALATLQQTEVAQCAGGCCKEEAMPDAGAPVTDNCSDRCNPFLSCSSNGIYLHDNPTVSTAAVFININKHAACSQDTYAQFWADVWQPPRLASS